MSPNESPRNPLLETARLRLRVPERGDAPFYLRLYNEPSFHQFIGDRGLRTEEDAWQMIRTNVHECFDRNGWGMFLVEIRAEARPVGVCGLVSRPGLAHPDLGFAFAPRFWRQGYARESSGAILRACRERWALSEVLAITQPDNEASQRLLEQLGFERRAPIELEGQTQSLFHLALQ